ncbi:methylmalonyl-CoA epimerase [Pleomorphovibrio marinus]|uniref:methylmalonyl-CoA epimerase n=1 Tax=Pleomorphovibrio marinus TaxID=2164132 RepID=UPI001E301811|nr:methylmalonyl-CoA epimerase [Pleomorphovibrio marinus]
MFFQILKPYLYAQNQQQSEMKLDHVGIAVDNLPESNLLFERLLGAPPYKEETVTGENVKVSFFQTGDTKLELLQALTEDSPIAKFLSKHKPGIHHLAFKVEDVALAAVEMEKSGFEVLTNPPKIGADNKLVVFLHPKTTNGVLIELCQELKQQ